MQTLEVMCTLLRKRCVVRTGMIYHFNTGHFYPLPAQTNFQLSALSHSDNYSVMLHCNPYKFLSFFFTQIELSFGGNCHWIFYFLRYKQKKSENLEKKKTFFFSYYYKILQISNFSS
ncbi:hypothetical protein AB205_0194250 [Aquarana catesbeiana]|uniref:Uncharacterized protein n=1 Tax=Aquarana catesbeiana TaxID=8400 RepID=A0A2G9S949_AQUCT|nr:hypothetical protein AB205_0194250 [Aquarana catesbeiana]